MYVYTYVCTVYDILVTSDVFLSIAHTPMLYIVQICTVFIFKDLVVLIEIDEENIDPL